jgi:DNA-binding LytR/AlgR family response regulator
VFDQIKFKQPVIFVTAFDEYAIDAFKTNSIDYLLKPIRFTDVSKALNKYKNFKTILNSDNSDLASKLQKMKKIKDRFLVRLGNHIHSIQTKDIALFYAEGRDVFLVTFSGKKFMLDFNLESLSQVLDTKLFFRISRTYIINLEAIANVIVYSNNRLKINPKVNIDGEIIISRSRVSGFKNWFDGN